jgi:hypothetical protein
LTKARRALVNVWRNEREREREDAAPKNYSVTMTLRDCFYMFLSLLYPLFICSYTFMASIIYDEFFNVNSFGEVF